MSLETTRQLSEEADTDLRPGDQALLDVIYADGAQDGCTLARPRALRLTLPAGGTVTVTNPPFPAGNCLGLSVDAFYVPRAAEPIPVPIDFLQVSLRVPKTVRAGTVLSYTVTLTNPTTEPISLTPCPGYWAHGFYQGQSVVHDQLNCDGHRAIAGGASLTFAMHIPVPPVADPGAPLYWHLDTPTYQDGGTSPRFREASAGIVVTAAPQLDGSPPTG